jgi:hypothetical protein
MTFLRSVKEYTRVDKIKFEDGQKELNIYAVSAIDGYRAKWLKIT